MHRPRARSWLAALMALVCCACAQLPGAQSGAVDDYMKTEIAKRHIPGAALIVIQHGQIVKVQGYGVATIEHDVPVIPDTVFELASVTKQFTAAAIMLLVEENKIGLDDPISRYLADTPDTWRGITVRHLLTHTAGFPGLDKGFATLSALWRANYTTAQLFASAKRDAMSFAPGERWQYSDVGYFLLGMIVEKASGERYREFLAGRFFQPLGMTHTTVLDQWAIIKNLAAGYTLRKGETIRIRRISQVELPSHYGVFSTVNDLAKWELALASGKVLQRASLEQMWTAVKLNDGSSFPYGFGWGVDEIRGHRLISHTGITGTQYSRYPDDGLTVIVLTNLGTFVGAAEVNSWGLTSGVAGRYIPNLLVSSLAEQPLPDPQLLEQAKGLLFAVAAGEDSPSMTPGLRKAITPESRKFLAQRMNALTSFTFLACENVDGRVLEWFGARVSRLCYYKLRTPDETRYYTFSLTADGQVANFRSALE
jgi:D-alanyl-D-alanine carboxypeptidase